MKSRKRCPRCSKTKPASGFYVARGKYDGLTGHCRKCMLEYGKAHRAIPHIRAAITARQKTARATEAGRAATSRYNKRYMNRYNAWVTKRQALDPRYMWRIKRDSHLRKNFGISLVGWEKIFAEQGESCAICRRKDPGTIVNWHTDHCHTSGTVRGILCGHCNLALGYVHETESVCVGLATYVRDRCRLPWRAARARGSRATS